jgi:hypothetical protein
MAEQKEIGEVLVASIRKQQANSHIGSFISASAIQLLVYLKELGTMQEIENTYFLVGVEASGKGFAIHHSQGGENADVEACVPVSTKGADRGDIKFKTSNFFK